MGKSSYTVRKKDLLQVEHCGLNSDDLDVISKVVTYRPVKVDLELVLPSEQDESKIEKGVEAVCKKYSKLLGKQASSSFSVIAECYREDQRGSTKAYGEADSALGKLNKFVEKQMEDFRGELRAAVASELGLKAKQLMTVGHISTKESFLKSGEFRSETAIDKAQDSDADEELEKAVMCKDWQYVGVALRTIQSRVAFNRKKAFTANTVKRLAKLYPKNERAGLRFAQGKVLAKSAGTFLFEFLQTEPIREKKQGMEKLLRAGLENQLGYNCVVRVELGLDKYTDDKSAEKKKEKEKSQTGADSKTPKAGREAKGSAGPKTKTTTGTT